MVLKPCSDNSQGSLDNAVTRRSQLVLIFSPASGKRFVHQFVRNADVRIFPCAYHGWRLRDQFALLASASEHAEDIGGKVR
jgi:hypothetical protein